MDAVRQQNKIIALCETQTRGPLLTNMMSCVNQRAGTPTGACTVLAPWVWLDKPMVQAPVGVH
jgi:hypothetical protein